MSCRLYDRSTNAIYTRRDIVFEEYDFGCTQILNFDKQYNINRMSSVLTVVPLTNELTGVQEESMNAKPSRISQLHCQPPVSFGFDEYVPAALAQREGHVTESSNICEARSSSNAAEWLEAARTEYNSTIQQSLHCSTATRR